MKEATGELNMTVITVVAIAAVAAFFYIFVWPAIQNSIGQSTCENSCAANKDGSKMGKYNKDAPAGQQCDCTQPAPK